MPSRARKEPNETVRQRVHGALEDARKTLIDVHVALNANAGTADERISYDHVAKICRGASEDEGPKAQRVRELVATLTGKSIEWLFMLPPRGDTNGNGNDSGGGAPGAVAGGQA